MNHFFFGMWNDIQEAEPPEGVEVLAGRGSDVAVTTWKRGVGVNFGEFLLGCPTSI